MGQVCRQEEPWAAYLSARIRCGKQHDEYAHRQEGAIVLTAWLYRRQCATQAFYCILASGPRCSRRRTIAGGLHCHFCELAAKILVQFIRAVVGPRGSLSAFVLLCPFSYFRVYFSEEHRVPGMCFSERPRTPFRFKNKCRLSYLLLALLSSLRLTSVSR